MGREVLNVWTFKLQGHAAQSSAVLNRDTCDTSPWLVQVTDSPSNVVSFSKCEEPLKWACKRGLYYKVRMSNLIPLMKALTFRQWLVIFTCVTIYHSIYIYSQYTDIVSQRGIVGNSIKAQPPFQRFLQVAQPPTFMTNRVHRETLKQFREELYAEGILHDGDTIGTNDETLLYV